jgi:hypothetical protein
LSREFESYNVGRNLFLSKFCLESGLDDSVGTFFEEISSSLAQLDIHIESTDIACAENIDEFLFDRLNEKEIALLSLGVAVGMIQSVLLSSSTDETIPHSTKDKMMGTINLAMQRIHMVLVELGIPEIAGPLVDHIQPLLSDFEKLRASKAALLSDIQVFEGQLKMRLEN